MKISFVNIHACMHAGTKCPNVQPRVYAPFVCIRARIYTKIDLVVSYHLMSLSLKPEDPCFRCRDIQLLVTIDFWPIFNGKFRFFLLL